MSRFLFVISAAVALAQPVGAQQISEDSARVAIDRAFARWSGTDTPGCAVGVSRSGKPVFEKGYGMANLESDTPIRPGSIFHVASISKQFTAMAVMLLARDGKLSVDDDVRRYITEIPDYGTPDHDSASAHPHERAARPVGPARLRARPVRGGSHHGGGRDGHRAAPEGAQLQAGRRVPVQQHRLHAARRDREAR